MAIKGRIFAVIAAIWAGFIFSNSLKVGVASTSMSNGPVDMVMSFLAKLSLHPDVDIITVLVRKSAHFAEFMLLGILIALSVVLSGNRVSIYLFCILFFCLLAGVTDEFIQSFIVGRSSEVRDVVIDFGGAVVGVISVWVISMVGFKKRRRVRH